jgi:prophage maintenance system killer protein
MRTTIIFAIMFMALVGCSTAASNEMSITMIETCGKACRTDGIVMQSYSEKDGCRCASLAAMQKENIAPSK